MTRGTEWDMARMRRVGEERRKQVSLGAPTQNLCPKASERGTTHRLELRDASGLSGLLGVGRTRHGCSETPSATLAGWRALAGAAREVWPRTRLLSLQVDPADVSAPGRLQHRATTHIASSHGCFGALLDVRKRSQKS